jgi:hypothetical protein
MFSRLVWSAVAAAIAAGASVVLAYLGSASESLAFGLAAVTLAVLSTRERT